MRVSSRLSLLFAALAVSVAAIVGTVAVRQSYASQIAALDHDLHDVLSAAAGPKPEALAKALNSVSLPGVDILMVTVNARNQTSELHLASVTATTLPTWRDAQTLLNRIGSIPSLPHFRSTAIDIGAGLLLVVATPTSTVEASSDHLTKSVIVIGALAALFAIAGAQLAWRRDRRGLRAVVTLARDVAAGDLEATSPTFHSSSDLLELDEAIHVLIKELRLRLETERSQADVMQQLLGDVSHEMRTPLTVIKGYRDLLASHSLDEAGTDRALHRLAHEIVRLESLVEDLLLSAQLRGKPMVNLDDVDLSPVVRARTVEWHEENSSHELILSCEDSLRVKGRIDLVERLVRNALSNISRYTPADAPVRVSVTRDNNYALLAIEDGGEGLPFYGEAPPRFWRGDDSRSRDTGGTGLGMSIMSDVAASLQGHFRTRPSELGGLCVEIRLPLSGDAADVGLL